MKNVRSRGIGLVTCIYVNPKKGLFWIVDYRIYDPDGDGKTKLDHVEDMLNGVVYHKQLHASGRQKWIVGMRPKI